MKLLQPGSTFIDGVANIGYFSLLAAKRCPGASIISLEPVAVSYRAFLENIALNGYKNIEALNLAAGGK
jgi:FkbM family methyltransferase